MRSDLNLLALRAKMRAEGIPVIGYQAWECMLDIINTYTPKRILEIGSAVGISALFMAQHSQAYIVSLEKDDTLHQRALAHRKAFGMEERIAFIHADALRADLSVFGMFDLIFIDGAKAQSLRFFERIEPFLNPKGIIVTDNVLFRRLTVAETRSRNVRRMVRRMEEYRLFLLEHPNYVTTIHDIDDGLAISIQKEESA